jgi:hypothetical protein
MGFTITALSKFQNKTSCDHESKQCYWLLVCDVRQSSTKLHELQQTMEPSQGSETLRLPQFLDNWLTNSEWCSYHSYMPVALHYQKDSWNSVLLGVELTPRPLG